jgi:hypothetical protein
MYPWRCSLYYMYRWRCSLYSMYREHVQPINKLLQLTSYKSVCYIYSTPMNFQQLFDMPETNIPSTPFVRLLWSLIMVQQGPIRVVVSGSYNIIVTVIQLCACVG